MKLFYQQNVYDWLDGYTGLYGGGFIWRKKMDSLWDVFKGLGPTPNLGPTLGPTPNPSRGEGRLDSLNVNKE